MPKTADGEWLSVQAGAKAGSVPVRSVYRWIKSGKLRCIKENGKQYVDGAALRRLAAARSATPGAAPRPDIAGNVAGNPAMAGNPARIGTESDGALAARVFDKLEAGSSPMDVVRELELPPERVRSLHREWEAMKNVGAGKDKAKKSETDERLDRLERLLYPLTVYGETLGDYFAQFVGNALQALAAHLDPVFRVTRCHCGGHLQHFLPAVCQSCETRYDLPLGMPDR